MTAEYWFLRWYELSKTTEYWAYYWKVYGLGEEGILLEERIMPFIQWAKEVPKDAIEIPSGLDFGFFPDPTAFCRLWIRKNDSLRDDLYIKEIVYDTKLSINTLSEGSTNLVEELKRKGVNPNHLIIAESADPRAVEEMRRAGFSIQAVKKTSVETSIRLFHDYNIHVIEGGENAYWELDNYKYKRDPKGIIMAIPAPGQKDHICDLLRYVLMSRNKRWSI
jgi:phage terminase large subunit